MKWASTFLATCASGISMGIDDMPEDVEKKVPLLQQSSFLNCGPMGCGKTEEEADAAGADAAGADAAKEEAPATPEAKSGDVNSGFTYNFVDDQGTQLKDVTVDGSKQLREQLIGEVKPQSGQSQVSAARAQHPKLWTELTLIPVRDAFRRIQAESEGKTNSDDGGLGNVESPNINIGRQFLLVAKEMMSNQETTRMSTDDQAQVYTWEKPAADGGDAETVTLRVQGSRFRVTMELTDNTVNEKKYRKVTVEKRSGDPNKPGYKPDLKGYKLMPIEGELDIMVTIGRMGLSSKVVGGER